MKKVTVTIVALLLAVFPAFSEHVPVQTAQRVAQSFLNSKMEGSPQIHLIDFSEKAEFTNFYVFGNEHCFVIIAGDNAVHPVLGYSTEYGINADPMPEAVFDWLKAYDNEIASIKENHFETILEIQSEWEDLLNGRDLEPNTRNHVEPLIRTRWQYGTPFNNLCPADTAGPGGHAKTGCGAVAMAQLMNYWEHPVRGTGSFSYTPSSHPEYGTQTVNFGNTVYDWDHMRNVYQKSYSDIEAEAVATLMYHCGVSVSMDYGPDASGTSTSRIDDALIEYFNYNNSMSYKEKDGHYSDAQWIAMLKNDLDSERPIIYRGQSEGSSGGHIFLCDGYDENDYFHFNWGYLGRWDGFYAMGSLFGGADYSYGNRAIFGITPNATSINPPNNVIASVNGRNVSVTWSPVGDASSYKVYRDRDLIASNITNSSFTDANAPYGEHDYYIKSVKSDGTMSLKSNTSVVDVHYSGPIPANLQASVNGHNVNLSWNIPQSETAILQYGTGNPSAGLGGGGNGIYWAQRFPTTTISDYAGMAIQKVSFYFRRSGTYSISIYKGDEANPRELVYQQNYQASSTIGWQDIIFSNPVFIDYTKDLWVVFYADSGISHPATFCTYTGENVVNASLYSTAQQATIWKEFVNDGTTCSWLMKTYITDGTYTYNLYRNGNAVATDLSGTTYTDTNLPDGVYDYHVTTNYFGGESDPSDTVNVQIGEAGVQTTAFATGWNWWSSYVELGSNSLSLLEDGLGTNGVAIKSQDDGYASYLDGFGWYGSLSGLNNESSYQVSTNEACEVEMTGGLVNPATHSITLHPGWTWIGYPVNVTMGVDEALSGIVPQTEDMLKSQNDGYASYLAGYGWYGSLTTLNPGMGLMYKSNNSSSVTLTYPNGGSKEDLKANQTSENNHWQANLNAYPDNMSVMAVVELDEEELHSEHYELAAFANNECRGSARLMYVEPIDRYMAFLTVAGDETAELRFSLYDTETGEEYHNANGTLTYETNAVVGSFGNPFILGFHGTTGTDDEDSLVRVYPNPANDILTIQGEGLRSVTVFNALGQKIGDVEVEGQEEIRIRVRDYEPGVYVLRIQTEKGRTVKQFIKE